jgi:hypothetical protein
LSIQFRWLKKNYYHVYEEAWLDETEKEKQNKSLISHLSKTIIDKSKVLYDYGMSPPIVSRILEVVSMNYFNKRNQESEELRNIRMLRQQAKAMSIFHLTMMSNIITKKEIQQMNMIQIEYFRIKSKMIY